MLPSVGVPGASVSDDSSC